MNKEQIFKDALSLPPNAISYAVSQHLAGLFPQKALIEGNTGHFDIEDYARSGLCQLEMKPFIHNQIITQWIPPDISQRPRALLSTVDGVQRPSISSEKYNTYAKSVWSSVEWQGATFDVVQMRWSEYGRTISYSWIVADKQQLALDLLDAVSQWNAEIRNEVLVFNNGCWNKDSRLFEAIKGSTFDNLILEGALKEDIHNDLKYFFSARTTYEEYGIPWKRGILFVGPPGNGKTHAIKAVLNALSIPCLYVKSFRAEHRTDEENIHQIFDRARKAAPCILVLEDLDSLLTAQNRSFFLNELDGFAGNIGILTLATTNHPERLDPAILDRPSRFDRKYHFNLPEESERIAYIQMWNETLKPALRLSEAGITKLAGLTEGFSYAYLKELFLSAMMYWVNQTQNSHAMDEVIATQVGPLREQMISSHSEEPAQQHQPAIPRRIFRSEFPHIISYDA